MTEAMEERTHHGAREESPGGTLSLGLKLMNFLAKHQLRATVDVRSGPGTEYELRFPVNQRHRNDP